MTKRHKNINNNKPRKQKNIFVRLKRKDNKTQISLTNGNKEKIPRLPRVIVE